MSGKINSSLIWEVTFCFEGHDLAIVLAIVKNLSLPPPLTDVSLSETPSFNFIRVFKD